MYLSGCPKEDIPFRWVEPGNHGEVKEKRKFPGNYSVVFISPLKFLA